MEPVARWGAAIALIVAWGVAGGGGAWGADEAATDGTIEYRGRVHRNPFHGLLPTQPEPSAASAAPAEPPALSITGVVWGGQQPLAIVDGRLVGIGDVVQGVEIVAIDRGAVRVRLEGREFLLKVP